MYEEWHDYDLKDYAIDNENGSGLEPFKAIPGPKEWARDWYMQLYGLHHPSEPDKDNLACLEREILRHPSQYEWEEITMQGLAETYTPMPSHPGLFYRKDLGTFLCICRLNHHLIFKL
jgi:hypothetical protein